MTVPGRSLRRLPFVAPVALSVALLLLLSGGCDVPKRPPLKSSASAPPAPAEGDASGDSKPAASGSPERLSDWQTWEVYKIGGRPVGFRHVTCGASEAGSGSDGEGDGAVRRCVVEDELTLGRGGAQITQRLRQTTTERPSGELLEIESELAVGPAMTRYQGSVSGSELVLETYRGQQRRAESLQWQTRFRGPLAVEQTLRRRPLQPAESRTLKMLLPVTHRVATVRLDCVGEASVPLLDGQHRTLLEVTSRVLLDDRVASRSVMWVDHDGRIQRTYTPAVDLVGYRTDQATAEEAIAEIAERPGLAWLDVTGRLEDPDAVRRVAYRVSVATSGEEEGGDRGDQTPMEIEPAAGQYVRKKEPGQFEVLVSRRAERATGGFAAADRSTEKADLAATAVLDFRSRSVRDISDAAVASDDLSEREMALELCRTVHALMELERPSGGVRPASEVARSTGGDPTDHAVLLAALLRARGIPSRLALGLRYLPGESPKMVYHVWTLAHVEGNWVPLDPIVGAAAPPDRLTLSTTHAGDGELPEVMGRLLNMLGRLQVHVQGSQ